MQNDSPDRIDLCRLADDGCPHGPTGDTGSHELPALWALLGQDPPEWAA
ncbi:MAG: hypothetical protein K2V38_00685 [Gemmataceae bacterium]|nr:hypothetical protein [Gemmataceae bacterium]